MLINERGKSNSLWRGVGAGQPREVRSTPFYTHGRVRDERTSPHTWNPTPLVLIGAHTRAPAACLLRGGGEDLHGAGPYLLTTAGNFVGPPHICRAMKKGSDASQVHHTQADTLTRKCVAGPPSHCSPLASISFGTMLTR